MTPRLSPASGVCLILPPRLCGGIDDYVAAWSAAGSCRRWDVRFDKREKTTHRFTIADTRGPLDLTVPIEKPQSHRCLWSDIHISDHGSWWDVHRVALESAYGRTPYFEFYIDRFLPMLTTGVIDRFPLLEQLAGAWEREIRDILSLGHETYPVTDVTPVVMNPGLRYLTPAYRQVREDKLGFIPGLSILDLVFNLGPESQFYLNSVAVEMLKSPSLPQFLERPVC